MPQLLYHVKPLPTCSLRTNMSFDGAKKNSRRPFHATPKKGAESSPLDDFFAKIRESGPRESFHLVNSKETMSRMALEPPARNPGLKVTMPYQQSLDRKHRQRSPSPVPRPKRRSLARGKRQPADDSKVAGLRIQSRPETALRSRPSLPSTISKDNTGGEDARKAEMLASFGRHLRRRDIFKEPQPAAQPPESKMPPTPRLEPDDFFPGRNASDYGDTEEVLPASPPSSNYWNDERPLPTYNPVSDWRNPKSPIIIPDEFGSMSNDFIVDYMQMNGFNAAQDAGLGLGSVLSTLPLERTRSRNPTHTLTREREPAPELWKTELRPWADLEDIKDYQSSSVRPPAPQVQPRERFLKPARPQKPRANSSVEWTARRDSTVAKLSMPGPSYIRRPPGNQPPTAKSRTYNGYLRRGPLISRDASAKPDA